jgi:nucleoside-diphosphate-sugar epimerase
VAVRQGSLEGLGVRILITGNMGYVGPSVVKRLRAACPGATLIGLDMGYFANILSNAAILPECRVDRQYFADTRRAPTDVLDNVDAVVHLAAISNDPMGRRFERVTYAINHEATVSLATMAKAAGVSSFILASSCSVYGAAGDEARDEKSPVAPLTAYSKSKILAEEGLAALAGHGFQVTCLRFATACGMSERLRLDLVLNDFVAAAVATKRVRILSDGTPWRPLIHIEDMARAIEWAIQRAESVGDFVAVNVGEDAWNYQVRDLATAVADVLPGVEVSVNTAAAADARSYRVSFEQFRRLAPDHQPRRRLHDTVTELAEGFDRMKFVDENFRESSFVRLNALSNLRDRGLLDENLAWTSAACDQTPSA